MATLVNAGLEYLAKLMVGVSTNPFKYIALGSGTTDEAITQTALDTEITTFGGSRALGTGSYEADYKGVCAKTFSFTGNLSINECGLFDAASTGNMAIRHKFSTTRSVVNGDSIAITFKTTFTRTT